MKIKAIKLSGVWREGAGLMVASLITSLFSYLFNLVMVARLGPADFGVMMSAFSLMVVLAVFLSTIQLVVARYTAAVFSRGAFSRMPGLFRSGLLRTTGLGAVLLAGLAVSSPLWASYLHISKVPILLIGLSLFFGLLAQFNRGILQGLQMFWPFGFNISFEAVVRLIFGVILVGIGWGVAGALFSHALAGLSAGIIGYLALKPVIKKSGPDSTAGESADGTSADLPVAEILKYAGPVFLSMAGFNFIISIDLIMVKHFFTAVDAGFYAGAQMLSKISLYLVFATIPVLIFPKVVARSERGEDSKPILYMALLASGLFNAVLTFVFFLAPEPLIRLFVGSAYVPGAGLLGWLAITVTFFSMAVILIHFHLSQGTFGFIVPLFGTAVLQVLLVSFFHRSLMQVVEIVILCSCLLCAGLMLTLRSRKPQHKPGLTGGQSIV